MYLFAKIPTTIWFCSFALSSSFAELNNCGANTQVAWLAHLENLSAGQLSFCGEMAAGGRVVDRSLCLENQGEPGSSIQASHERSLALKEPIANRNCQQDWL